jgi:hypothetical protein
MYGNLLWQESSDTLGKTHGIERCPNLHIIVKIDKHVTGSPLLWTCLRNMLGVFQFGAFYPSGKLGGPLVEGLGGVAADVELFVAVEADVDEVGREVFEEGPFAGGVGDDEGDVVVAEELDEVGGFEGGVADFHGVAEGGVFVDFGEGAAFHEGGVGVGELGGLVGVAREFFEEGGDAFGVVGEVGGELPEDGAEFFLEGEEALGEEVRERFVDVFEAAHVGDVAAAFDGEDEAGGGFVIPALPTGGALEGVEGAVDFDGVDLAGGEFEFAFLGEVFGVEGASPGGVAPAGDADSDLGHGGLFCVRGTDAMRLRAHMRHGSSSTQTRGTRGRLLVVNACVWAFYGFRGWR